MQRLLLVALLVLAGCGGGPGTYQNVGGSPARVWGDGPYGLVLVHDAGRDGASWDAAATAFAADGTTVLAPDAADPVTVVAALRFLLDRPNVDRVALLGAGTGAAVAMAVAARNPSLVDQLIVISATGDVSALGALPKLFVASTGEGAAADAQRMARDAAGDWNEVYLAEGSETGQAILEGQGRAGAMEAITRRLDERR